MADIPTALSHYLAGMRLRRWRFGEFDCAVFMADWVIELTGVDPIADVRGSYETERQYLRIVRREGGFLKACGQRLAAAGLVPTRTPLAGDIAAVLAPYAMRRGKVQRRPTGAICCGTACAVATSDLGIVIAPVPMLDAWTVAHA